MRIDFRWAALLAAVGAAGANAGGLHRAYVEVQGDTIALTAGPEVGRYTRELRPTRVLVVRRTSRTECP